VFVDHIKGKEMSPNRVLKKGEKRFTFILKELGYEYRFTPKAAWDGRDIKAVRKLLRQAYLLHKYSLAKRSL
tara:strand:- start:557 stop:772 length:216 start_codon:yes stop_codon:yes gene_type:complete